MLEILPAFRSLAWLCLSFYLGLFAAVTDNSALAAEPRPSAGVQGYVGSVGCRQCHDGFYQLWATSHHGLAMQPYTDKFALTQLKPQTTPIAVGCFRYQAEVGPGQGAVLEQGPDGEKRYPIVQVLGGKNVYYFLTPMERGRLQTLPLAYDVRRGDWFDVAASGVRHVSDAPVDWREPAYTFNTACHGCHVSQLSTNYDLKTDTYRSQWLESGINCETCHGPAEEHVRVCLAAPEGKAPSDLKIIRGGREFTAEQQNAACAVCHARMVPLTSSFQPGGLFFDHYDLTTLEDLGFYPDGRDLGENYTYTLWRMSPCAKSGRLSCLDCHTSSGRFKQKESPNQACLPCHASRVQNAGEHTHHPPESKGSQCISCHMPATEFARMRRSDHSMLPPCPAATMAFGSPNACNLCHREKDAAWADAWVRQWRKRDYQAGVLYRAGLIEAARKRDWSKLELVLAYVGHADRDEVFAVSLIRLLRSCQDPRVAPLLIKSLEDPSVLIRGAAADALRLWPSPEAARALFKALAEESRLVRVRAAGALAGYPQVLLGTGPGEKGWRQWELASKELLDSLMTRPDHWTTHYNLGNFHLEAGNPSGAMTAYQAALKLEPRAVMVLVNLSIAHARIGENDQAESCLRQALALDPNHPAANFNLGLLKAEQQDLPKAEEHLRAALKADPQMHAAAYNLGLLMVKSRPKEALGLIGQAYEQQKNPKYAYAIAFYLKENGELTPAAIILNDALKRWPLFAEAYFLLGEIHETQGRTEEAESVYKSALAQREFSPALRQHFETRLKALTLVKEKHR